MLSIQKKSDVGVTLQSNDSVLLEVAGRITVGESSHQFRLKIRELIEKEGCKKIVIDLSGVEYMDAAGIEELTGVIKWMAKRGGVLESIHLSTRMEVAEYIQQYLVSTGRQARAAIA